MTDPREALLALLWQADHAPLSTHDPRDGSCQSCPWPLHEMPPEDIADAILAAGWTPHGERVKPTLEQVVDALAAQRPGSAEWTSSRIMQTARAVLALLPGRSEAEVKAEALREAAAAIGTYDEGDVHLWARDADTWLLDRADRIEKEADDDR